LQTGGIEEVNKKKRGKLLAHPGIFAFIEARWSVGLTGVKGHGIRTPLGFWLGWLTLDFEFFMLGIDFGLAGNYELRTANWGPDLI